LDILSIIGLVLALNAILVGAVLKGAGLMALVSAAAFMIVVVGTLAAICIQTPLPVMQRALKIFPWVLRPPVRDGRLLLDCRTLTGGECAEVAAAVHACR